MRYLPYFLALLISLPSYADIRGRGGYSFVDSATTAPLTLYVATTGADTNSCKVIGSPCLTLQAAVNKIPKRVRHEVTISIGAGSFAGANIEGFVFEPLYSTANKLAMLRIEGSMADWTPATGSVSGTVTAYTAATSTDFSFINVAGEIWTVDDLRGSFLVITGGSGVGQIFAIESNDADDIYFGASASPVLDGTSTFSIQRPSATIGQVPAPGSSANSLTFSFLGRTQPATHTPSYVNSVYINKLDFSKNISLALGVRMHIKYNRFIGGSGSGPVATMSTDVIINNCYFLNGSVLNSSGYNNLTLEYNVADGTTTTAFNVMAGVSGASLITTKNSLRGQKIVCSGRYAGTGDLIKDAPAYALEVGFDTNGKPSPCYAYLSAMRIDGAVTGAVRINLLSHVSDTGTLAGAANGGYGWTVQDGASLKISATTALTGVTGDVLLDDVARTYVNIRAAGPPKNFLGAVSGARVWEP